MKNTEKIALARTIATHVHRWGIICMMLLLVLALGSAAAKAPPAAVKVSTLMVLGDSLSAAHGISVQQGWVTLLANRLSAQRQPWRVHNISVSGETTAGGKARLQQALDTQKPALVLIALGANDGLRGLPIALMQANLLAMVKACKASGAQVLLIGIRIPPNYGPDYTRAFEQAYKTTAEAEKIPLLPFLLEPIALDSAAFQSDRLHPTAAAQAALQRHVYSAVLPLITKSAAN
jgi:acyl-CoA thioesterase I